MARLMRLKSALPAAMAGEDMGGSWNSTAHDSEKWEGSSARTGVSDDVLTLTLA
jgi:hypothetical protein